MDLVDLTDQAQVLLALVEKALIKTEDIAEIEICDEAAAAALDYHLATLELKRVAGDLHRIAEDMLVAALGNQRRLTVGDKTIEIRRAYKRTDWEHSKVATHVAMRALGGEVIEGMDVVIDAFLKACSPSWRVTVLKEMGLDDADYAERTLGRATVTVL